MKKVLIAVAAATMVFAGGTAGLAGGPPGGDGDGPPGQERVRVIVELAERGQATAVLASLGNAASDVVATSHLPYLILEVPRAAMAGLERSPGVVSVHEDIPEPPSLASTIPIINGDDVHDLGFTGAGATVAVLDAGIDDDHDFFGVDGARIVAERCFSTDNGTDVLSLCPDGTTIDVDADIDGPHCLNGTVNICDHGTHVAGIAAGSAASDPGNAPGDGVAPGANIIAVQVFSRFTDPSDCLFGAPCVLSYPSDQILGLNAVLSLAVANPDWNVVAANMSLGGGQYFSACDGNSRKPAIDALLNAGIATTISAGNNGFNSSVGAPACISSAVTVGSTDDDDTIAPYSNRGVLLDIFAPGTDVDSAEAAGTYGSKSGTSMAAPHVAGALAVMREAYPSRPIGDLIDDLTATGVPIDYSSRGSDVTTPRLDLLAALQNPNVPPVLTADDVTVDEGDVATNTGTATDSDGVVVSIEASSGSVSLDGDVWTWSEQTSDGPSSTTVTITATDDKDETSTVDFTLDVDNVAPIVTFDPAQQVVVDEGDVLALAATFTDPGWPDTYAAAVDYGTLLGSAGPVNLDVLEGGPGTPDQGTVTTGYTYGDNGTFDVVISVTDDDGGVGDDSVSVTVDNVAPTAEIDLTGATSWNGMDVFFGEAGVPVTFDGDSTDPGSDDITMDWSFGDGGADSVTDLVNPPDPDPAVSPTVQPRAVSDSTEHTYSSACSYTLGFGATDDDGGAASDSADVVVFGNADDARTIGYWFTEYWAKRASDFSSDDLDCFLAMVNLLSSVFDEARDLSSTQDAVDVLWLKKNAGATDIFDAQLLGVWLNVANGALDLGQVVDTDGDLVPDSVLGDVIVTAESVRLDAGASDADLLAQKDVLEYLNVTY
jgi:subtilisin family serine protease